MKKIFACAIKDPLDTVLVLLAIVFLPTFYSENTYISGVVTGTSLMYIMKWLDTLVAEVRAEVRADETRKADVPVPPDILQ